MEEFKEATPEEIAARPKLKLQPRKSDKPPAAKAETGRSSIFGAGKPRDEKVYESQKKDRRKDDEGSTTSSQGD